MVSELLKENEEAERQHAAELELAKLSAGETIAEKLVREKEERKKKALERSASRQAQTEYFETRKKANEECASTSRGGKANMPVSSEEDALSEAQKSGVDEAAGEVDECNKR